MDWLEIAAKFQTAIAATIGFGGVILTLVTNASAARHLDLFRGASSFGGSANIVTARLVASDLAPAGGAASA